MGDETRYSIVVVHYDDDWNETGETAVVLPEEACSLYKAQAILRARRDFEPHEASITAWEVDPETAEWDSVGRLSGEEFLVDPDAIFWPEPFQKGDV